MRSWVRDDANGDAHRQQTQHRGRPEYPRDADPGIQDRAKDHTRCKGYTNADTDGRHDLCAMLFTCQVRGERQYRGRHGARALQGAAHDDADDGVGECGHDAPDYEKCEREQDHGLAADTIGECPKRDLEGRLREPVDTQGKPDQKRGVALQFRAVHGEDRQDHEQAQHADNIDGGERVGGTPLQRRHFIVECR